MNTQTLQLIIEAVRGVSGDAKNVLYAYFGYNMAIALLVFIGFCLVLLLIKWSIGNSNANDCSKVEQEMGQHREELKSLLGLHPYSDWAAIKREVSKRK